MFTAGLCGACAELSGGRVVIALLSDVNGLNPLLSTDPRSTTASQRIYSSAFGYDPKTGETVAHLAESWSIGPDNTSVTITLRDNLSWSDGSPLTVDDMHFTLEALLRSKKAPAKTTLTGEVVGAQDFADGTTQQVDGISNSGRSREIITTICSPGM